MSHVSLQLPGDWNPKPLPSSTVGVQDYLGQLHISQAGMKYLLCLSSLAGPPSENQQVCQQPGDCAWLVASRAARTRQVLAGLPEPHAECRPAWLPGLQGKQGRTQRGEGGQSRQEGEQVSQEPCRHKGPLVSSSWPREQPALPSSQALPRGPGQVSQGCRLTGSYRHLPTLNIGLAVDRVRPVRVYQLQKQDACCERVHQSSGSWGRCMSHFLQPRQLEKRWMGDVVSPGALGRRKCLTVTSDGSTGGMQGDLWVGSQGLATSSSLFTYL